MKSLHEQLAERRGKVVWMASYPKSGNTWFRCFLAALMTGKIDINHINTDGIFSSRHLFDHTADIDGRMLDEAEIKLQIAEVYRHHLKSSARLEFTKVHDAYTQDRLGRPIFPTDVSHKVIYLVRNPLDIVASFANHNSSSIDETINLMNNPNGYLARQNNGLNINNQFPQLMLDWSGHVKSWLDQKKIEVVLMRYEDTKRDPVGNYLRALNEIGLHVTKKKVKEAVSLSRFDRLQKLESEEGFREKNHKVKSFFRSGKSGGHKQELTPAQASAVTKAHRKMMKRLGYL